MIIRNSIHSPPIRLNQSHSISLSRRWLHSTCSTCSSSSNSSPTPSPNEESRHRSQYNYDPFTLNPTTEHYHHNLLTPLQLSKLKTRPREARILARDFIHDSLYNPNYGYFSKSAVLLPDGIGSASASDANGRVDKKGKGKGKQKELEQGITPTSRPFDFNSIKTENSFMKALEQRYFDFESSFKKLNPTQSPPIASSRKERKKPTVKVWSAEGLEEAQAKGRRSLIATQKERNVEEVLESEEMKPFNSPLTTSMGMGMGIGAKMDEKVDEDDIRSMAARQVWHTPTELFKPWYARSIARYLVQEYKHNLYPYDDLLIYELGAGSGSLASGILTYLRDEEPLIYERTRYRIVEISSRLTGVQMERLGEFGVVLKDGVEKKQGYGDSKKVEEKIERKRNLEKVEIINKDFLEWNQDVVEPCFVVALEVLDNLAHDVIKYSTSDFKPYQAMISIDSTGDMHELWEPVSDPLILEYLALSSTSNPYPPTSTYLQRLLPSSLRSLLSENFPFYPNLTASNYIPTHQLKLFQILKNHFPLHRLVFSDFNSLPESVDNLNESSILGLLAAGGGKGNGNGFFGKKKGNAPVVQTRIKGEMVPVSTYTVQQGYFDIFFPTDFEMMREVYQKVMMGFGKQSSNQDQTKPVPPSSTQIKPQFNSDKYLKNQSEDDQQNLQSRSSPRNSPLSRSSSLRPDYFSNPSNEQASVPLTSTSTSLSPTFFSSLSNQNHENSFSNHHQRRLSNLKIMNHSEFLLKFGEVEKTRLRDGSNPMVGWYQNAKWFLS